MSQNDQLRLELSIEADNAGKEAIQQLEALDKAAQKVEAQFDKAISTADVFQRELAKLERASRIDDLVESARKLKEETNDTSKAARELAENLERVGASESEIKRAVGAFQGRGSVAASTSNDGGDFTGRSGDLASGIGRTRGIAQAFGGDALTPLFDAAEALGDLGETAGNLVQSAGGGAKALAALGVAGGLLAVAIAGATFALQEYNKQAQAQASLLNAQIDAQRQLNSEIANGLTSDEARQRVETLNAEYQAQQELLDTLIEQYRSFEENAGLAAGALKLFDEREEALATQIQAQTDLVNDQAQEIKGLNQALEDGSLAANDAKIAEDELAASRTQGILDAASKEAELAQARIDARDVDQEALDALIQTERERLEVLNAEIAALKKSSDGSEQVKQRLETLSSQAQTAKEKLEIFNNTVAKTGEDAEKAASDATKGSQAAGGGFIVRIRKRTQETNNALNEAGKLQEKIANEQRNLVNKLNDLGLNISRSVEDLNIETARNLEDALREGSFLDIADIQREAGREREDIEREAERSRIDLVRDSREQILELERQYYQASIGLLQNAINSASGTRSGKPRFRTSFLGAVPS